MPSASSPVTRNAFGPIAATYTGTGVPPATRTGQPGLALNSSPVKSTAPVSKIDLNTVKCSRSRPIVLGHNDSECHSLGFMGPQPEAQAEVAVRRRLSRLRQRRHDQRMPRVDRNHEGADSKPGHRRADQPGQRDRIVVELLSQPDLVDADGRGRVWLGTTTSSTTLTAWGSGYSTTPVGIPRATALAGAGLFRSTRADLKPCLGALDCAGPRLPHRSSSCLPA